MPEQLTTKRKAEGPQHGPIDVPTTKKLRKASSQPALNSPPRPASAIDSSLSESPPPPSLTSGSSIEDSSSSTSSSFVDKSFASDLSLSESPPPPSLTLGSSIEDSSSSTANSLVDKSSASIASIEKSSTSPSVTKAPSKTMLQETRPTHGGTQETMEITVDDLCAMSLEQLEAYGRLRGWKDPPEKGSGIEYDSDDDFYQEELFAFEHQLLDANGDFKFEW